MQTLLFIFSLVTLMALGGYMFARIYISFNEQRKASEEKEAEATADEALEKLLSNASEDEKKEILKKLEKEREFQRRFEQEQAIKKIARAMESNTES